MKILMVSSYLPYPLHSGGNIRLYNILKKLNKKHNVTLVCEKRPYQTEKDIAEVKKICSKLITVFRKKQWNLSNILLSAVSPNSFLVTGHTLIPMREKIEGLLAKEKFDLIHAETFYITHNIPESSLPLVVAEHNIEYMVYQRFSRSASPLLKPLLYIDISKIKKNEEDTWKRANAVITVSKDDGEIVKQLNKNVYVIPNGVNINKFKIQNSKFKIDREEKTVLFIGNFKWVQNRDAAGFILKEVWPILKSKFKSEKLKIRLWIVGKNIPDYFKKYNNEDIVFDENAPDDTSLIFQKSDILLAPIRVGGGTSYKILEAMASGVAVVTTTLGASGLGVENNRDILIAESEDELIKGIQKLASDEGFYRKISKNARKLIEDKYTWEKIVKNLEEAYKQISSQ